MEHKEFTIEISTLWRIFVKNLLFIVSVTLALTVAMTLLSMYVIPKKYQASALLYLENKDSSSQTANINDMNAAQKLVRNSVVMFRGEKILRDLAETAQLDVPVKSLESMISVIAVDQTEVLKVTITSFSPEEAVRLTDIYIGLCIKTFKEIVESGTIKISDPASASGDPSFPNVKVFVAIGFAAGFAVSYIISFLRNMLDTKVKDDDDLFKVYEIPVFAEVLSFDAKVKGAYGAYNYAEHSVRI